MKLITFALTIYNPKLSEIDNYIYSFKKINTFYTDSENPVQFLIISDNPNIDTTLVEYIERKINQIPNCDFVISDKNYKRIGSVKKFQDLIQGKFLKLCDPDDFLIPDLTVKFIEDILSNLKGNELIIYSYKTTTEEILVDNYETLETKTFFWIASYNPNTVYPTETFKKIKWDFKLLIWSDDLLGYLIWKESKEIKYSKESSFYINRKAAGVSVTKRAHESMDFYNDSLSFLKLSNNNISSKKEKAMFILLTHKPNGWLYNQVANDLILNSKINDDERISLMKEIYLEGKKIRKSPNVNREIKQIKFGKNLITFVVPIYGKDPNKTFEYFSRLAASDVKANFVLSYKNSVDGTFNYDKLIEIESINPKFKVIKNDASALRTSKILKALDIVETKYFQVLDAHHTIDVKKLNSLDRKLRNSKSDHILTPYIWKNIDDNSKKIRLPKKYSLGAGTSIYSTELVKKYKNLINIDVVYFDDIVLSLYLYLARDLFDLKFKEKKLYSFHYSRNYGKEISSTTFTSEEMKADKELLKKQAEHMEIILSSIYKHIGTKEAFDKKLNEKYRELLIKYVEYTVWRSRRAQIDPWKMKNAINEILETV